MGRFNIKSEEKAPPDAKKEEKDLVAGTPFGGKLLLRRAKH